MRQVVAVRETWSLLLVKWWTLFWGEEMMVKMATMSLRCSTTTSAGRLKIVETGCVVMAGHVGAGRGC